jgi:hypothetical protein
MSSSQLVGHWSGKYGQEAGTQLATHIETAMRFGFYHQNKHRIENSERR